MIEKSSIHRAGRTAAVFLLFTALFIAVIPHHIAQAATPTGVLVPLYSYPGSLWTALIQAKNANPTVPFIAVISPDNGAGGWQDPSYVQGIRNLHSAGIKVLGYVYTSYTSRSASSVQADIYAYKSWYSVDGVFFDEMANWYGGENYYASLSQYAKSIGMTLTVGNPGASVPSTYIGTCDIIVIYESPGLPSVSYLDSLVQGYSKTNFGVISYGVPSLDTSWVSGASNDLGYMYMTDGSWPNPYDVLPSYLSNLLATLRNLFPSPSPSPSTTFPLNVLTASSTGAPITGLWTTIQSGSVTLLSGYTPVIFTATSGTTYQVTVADYGIYTFNHWDDGSTNRVRTVTVTQARTLTASYNVASLTPPPPTTVQMAVRSVNLVGTLITGLWTTIQSSGKTLVTGYTTLTYNAASGTAYTVSVADYGPYTFSHWDDGSTSRSRTITPAQAMTLTAYYNVATLTQPTLSFDTGPAEGSPIPLTLIIVLLVAITASSIALLRKQRAESKALSVRVG